MTDISLSMYQIAAQTARRLPMDTAIYYQGKKIPYYLFLRKIDQTADKLYKLGVRKGDTILIAQPNIPETLYIFYAVNKIGAIANMVHPFIPFNQMTSIIEKTHTKYSFLFEQRVAKEVEAYRGMSEKIFVTRIEDSLPFFKRIFYHVFFNKNIRKTLGRWRGKFKGFTYFKDIKPGDVHIEAAPNNRHEVSVLLHSGSTTGAPKTICLNNTSFNFIANHANEFACIKEGDLRHKGMLCVLPSFHGFGLCMTMHAPFLVGCTCVLIPKFSSKECVKAMNKIQLGVIIGIPGMYEKLLDDPKFANHKTLKGFIVAFSGGDSMNVSLNRRFDEAMKKAGSHARLFEGYGLTEAIAVNAVNTFEHNKEGSIGVAGSGFDMKIIDENENEVDRGVVGQIVTKSEAVMLHYFEDEEATKATFTHDGYLKTGDCGYMDEDGFIFFKQRLKRVVKVSGVGVFPSEIERLVETVPGVTQCCAISIPDPRLVSAVKIFVVAKYFDKEGMKRAIMDTCRKYLIRWAVPKEIEFRDSLPLTLLGKVDFKALQVEEDKKRSNKKD